MSSRKKERVSNDALKEDHGVYGSRDLNLPIVDGRRLERKSLRDDYGGQFYCLIPFPNRLESEKHQYFTRKGGAGHSPLNVIR